MNIFNSFFCCGSADAVIVPSSNEEVSMNQQLNTNNTSAIKIQSVARRHLVKQQLKKEAAAIKIQSVARGYLDRQLVKAKLERAKILKNQEDCPISLEPLDYANSSVTRCKHVFETATLLQSLNIKSECPLCRGDISIEDLLQDQLNIKNFKSALQIADTITDETNKSLALIEISQFYLKNGNHEEALKIAKNITNEKAKSFALIEISQFYLKDGNHEEALKIAASITFERMKTCALHNIYTEILVQVIDLIKNNKRDWTGDDIIACIKQTHTTMNVQQKETLIEGVKDILSEEEITLINNLQK